MTENLLEYWHWQSWVDSANSPARGFPLQNLPYCAFASDEGGVHLGVGIGSFILDLYKLSDEGYLSFMAADVGNACKKAHLNELMSCGPEAWSQLRQVLVGLLKKDASDDLQSALNRLLLPMVGTQFIVPVSVSNYTDFYASVDHATNVGRLFRPDQPLLPNYKFIPIAYHGRASSLVVSGELIRRPYGQTKAASDQAPSFQPTNQLDYELEVAAYIGQGNALGTPVPVTSAEQHIFGFSLLNDWSARDIQAWEYQPLGPFLGKNFATSLSPWIVVPEALAPFRVPRAARPEGDPAPLPYLQDDSLGHDTAIDMFLDVYLTTKKMRTSAMAPVLLSTGNLRDLYWSFSQMIAHHTSNGCNLVEGDLLGSGTISGSIEGSQGSLLELTQRGKNPLQLETGESRAFLQDGDEVILRGYCERAGFPRVSMGECRGTIAPAANFK